MIIAPNSHASEKNRGEVKGEYSKYGGDEEGNILSLYKGSLFSDIPTFKVYCILP